MKVLLVALNAKYVHSNLAVYDLEAYVKKNCAEAENLVVREYTINHNLDYILQMLYKEQAEVIAFSCYIWNIEEILSLSKDLKKINPQIRIWLGGPEVSYHSQQLLEQHAYIEGIIRGEGEETFSELYTSWQKGETYLHISGITCRNAYDDVVHTQDRALVSMDAVPFVYEELSAFQNKIIYYESSRGCPFSCSYCLSSIDKTVRFRNLDTTLKELQIFLDADVPQVKFIDRTFNCKKDRALQIWKYIFEHDNGVTNFHFEIAADLIGEEELTLFAKMRPGLIQLEIGLQSTNEKTIREIRRTMNIEKLRKNMLRVRAGGNIHQHLDLIAGLPYEDYESFQKSFCEAYAMQPHQLQLGFLKVLKGSHMEEMCENYGLIYHDRPPYEVMCTKWISYEEILKLKRLEEMVEVYHNSAQFTNTLPYLLAYFETPFQFFIELGNYYETNKLFSIGFKREARYEVLRDFAGAIVSSRQVLDELLTFDYYLRENAKSRPSWMAVESVEKEMYQQFFRRGGTELYSLIEHCKDGEYQSQVAARKMHIEKIMPETYQHIACIYGLHKVREEAKDVYCLFDYEKRNQLSKDAWVVFLDTI